MESKTQDGALERSQLRVTLQWIPNASWTGGTRGVIANGTAIGSRSLNPWNLGQFGGSGGFMGSSRRPRLTRKSPWTAHGAHLNHKRSITFSTIHQISCSFFLCLLADCLLEISIYSEHLDIGQSHFRGVSNPTHCSQGHPGSSLMGRHSLSGVWL